MHRIYIIINNNMKRSHRYDQRVPVDVLREPVVRGVRDERAEADGQAEEALRHSSVPHLKE